MPATRAISSPCSRVPFTDGNTPRSVTGNELVAALRTQVTTAPQIAKVADRLEVSMAAARPTSTARETIDPIVGSAGRMAANEHGQDYCPPSPSNVPNGSATVVLNYHYAPHFSDNAVTMSSGDMCYTMRLCVSFNPDHLYSNLCSIIQ